MTCNQDSLVDGNVLVARSGGREWICRVEVYKGNRIFSVDGIEGTFKSASGAGKAVIEAIGTARTPSCNGNAFWTPESEFRAKGAKATSSKSEHGPVKVRSSVEGFGGALYSYVNAEGDVAEAMVASLLGAEVPECEECEGAAQLVRDSLRALKESLAFFQSTRKAYEERVAAAAEAARVAAEAPKVMGYIGPGGSKNPSPVEAAKAANDSVKVGRVARAQKALAEAAAATRAEADAEKDLVEA